MSKDASCTPLVIVPARMASTRLPGKPLAKIDGLPMIVQVWSRAMEADIGPVVVACAERDIADAIEGVGGTAILTDPALPSGSDRCHAAADIFDPDHHYDAVINLQGDMPTLSPSVLHDLVAALDEDATCDLTTAANVITDPAELSNPNVVKVAANLEGTAQRGPALYFSRAAIPFGEGPHLHHIGVYGWRRSALKTFVDHPVAAIERRESLEQLRALAIGLRLTVCLTHVQPLGVDTAEDLEHVRAAWSKISP